MDRSRVLSEGDDPTTDVDMTNKIHSQSLFSAPPNNLTGTHYFLHSHSSLSASSVDGCIIDLGRNHRMVTMCAVRSFIWKGLTPAADDEPIFIHIDEMRCSQKNYRDSAKDSAVARVDQSCVAIVPSSSSGKGSMYWSSDAAEAHLVNATAVHQVTVSLRKCDNTAFTGCDFWAMDLILFGNPDLAYDK